MLVDERNLMFMLYVNIEQKHIYKYKWHWNVRKNMRALHEEVLNTTIRCIISPNAVHTAEFKNLSSYNILSVFTAIKRMAIIVMRCIYTRIWKVILCLRNMKLGCRQSKINVKECCKHVCIKQALQLTPIKREPTYISVFETVFIIGDQMRFTFLSLITCLWFLIWFVITNKL
jgi:hypothetical protein